MKRLLCATTMGILFLSVPAWAGPPESDKKTVDDLATALSDQVYTPATPTADPTLEKYFDHCEVIHRIESDPAGQNVISKWLDACGAQAKGASSPEKKREIEVGLTEAGEAVAWCNSPRSAGSRPSIAQLESVAGKLATYKDDLEIDGAGAKAVCHEPSRDDRAPIAAGAGTAVAFGAAFQEQFVQALSAFLIKRAKAEALNWASQRMGVEICKSGTEGELLLPNVCAVLFSGETRSTAPGMSWGVLRQAAIEDFRGLPPRLVKYVVGLATQECSGDKCLGDAGKQAILTTAFTFGAAWHVGNAVGTGETVLESIVGLEDYSDEYRAEVKVAEFVYLAALVAKESRVEVYESVKAGKPWVPTSREIDLMIGIIVSHLEPSSDLAKYLRGDDPKWMLRSEDVKLLVAHFTELAGLAKRAQDEGIDEQHQLKILAAVTKIFTTSSKIARDYLKIPQNEPLLCGGPTPDPSKCAVVALESTGFVLSMTHALVRQEYGAAFAEFLAYYRLHLDPSTLPPWFGSWVPFLADLASAKDVATMEAALESLAAPVGSYKVKRGSVFVELPKDDSRARKRAIKDAGGKNLHVMINAYVGVQGGAELLLTDGGLGGHVGPTASIGPELSLGIGKAGSLGFYVPILDVGMLADFRVGGNGVGSSLSTAEKVEATPHVGFAQVFAPGLFFVFGLGNTPLALAFGAQIAPVLRTTTSTDVALPSQDFTTLRFGGFLAIDIPVFIFR